MRSWLFRRGGRDVHLPPLIEALRGACGVERLDLSFNHLTDAGVHVLLKALASGAGLELSRVHLGGNRLVSGGGMAKSVWLTQLRADLDVDWSDTLPEARPMCTVGVVFPSSPAHAAGLRAGDSLLAFAHVQHAEWISVAESVVPLVKASVGKPIDVVVARVRGESGEPGSAGRARHLGLTLTPAEWSGNGLLGCTLK